MANELPILIAGGGIGGLAAAYALALKGVPVRVLEQAPEFREIGAGIQLGPNVFRALEKLGLEDAVLADAHQPPAMEMRCALTGECITRIPLDDPRFFARFRLPYAVTRIPSPRRGGARTLGSARSRRMNPTTRFPALRRDVTGARDPRAGSRAAGYAFG